MTATTNTHMTRRFSTGSSSSLGVSGSNTTGSGEDLSTRSLNPAHSRTPHLISLSAHDREREGSAAPLRNIASQSPSSRRISIVKSALLDSLSSPTSSDMPSPQVNGCIFCNA
jgi:hypothetical protein